MPRPRPSYVDLDRPPLREGSLVAALTRPPSLWREVRVLTRTGSTNAEVAARARAGAGEGLVVVAEVQDAGRGRLDRTWVAPPRAALLVSVLLHPETVQPARWGWLPLLAGVALARSVRRLARLPADAEPVLKWPNDLLLGDAKVAGVLAEVVGAGEQAGVVVGIGLNVTTRADELPHAEATSLAVAGAAVTDRSLLLRGVLRGFASWYAAWRDAAGDADACGLRAAYRQHCATLRQTVRVSLPGGEVVTGTASDIDAAGRLIVATGGGVERVLAAGDVVHLRGAGVSTPSPPPPRPAP